MRRASSEAVAASSRPESAATNAARYNPLEGLLAGRVEGFTLSGLYAIP